MYDTDRYEPLGLALNQRLDFVYNNGISENIKLSGTVKEIVCTDKLKKKFSYVEVLSDNGLAHFLVPNSNGEWQSTAEY